uniref:Uncharacterized protein n=1 Tax=Salix viminalis TaxID=40686 RepID=A0A6N2KIW8_SALVM
MGEAEEEGKKRRVMVESLGWLTESSILPKKHRAIEGVGASSIVQLKAQLNPKKKPRNLKIFPLLILNTIAPRRLFLLSTPSPRKTPASSPVPSSTPLSFSFIRVSFSFSEYSFDFRDKLELKAVNDGSASYAALERKAELYEKLVRGELSDEEENEKLLEHDESVRPRGNDTSYAAAPVDDKGKVDGDSDDSVLFNAKFVAPGRTAGAVVDKAQHHRLVREVHEEANQARKKVVELKLHRQEQATAKHEKLKQAYLRKKLEELKAASNANQT